MRIIDIKETGGEFEHRWPGGDVETYTSWIDYAASAADGKEHTIRIGKAIRETYGRERVRITAWIDDYVHAEFLGVDDFDVSGQIVSEIKLPGDPGERMCRYPEEPVPERYGGLQVTGLPTRVTGPGVHSAWAIICNIGDHQSIAALAGLRRLERWR
ncbi:MAG: hypothetical protein IIB22_08420 [Chloroflexi bacterium]|nr:hypothetical protein [Chloroflexota bacterium]